MRQKIKKGGGEWLETEKGGSKEEEGEKGRRGRL